MQLCGILPSFCMQQKVGFSLRSRALHSKVNIRHGIEKPLECGTYLTDVLHVFDHVLVAVALLSESGKIDVVFS